LPSSRRQENPRRQMFLKLSSQIEGQLREAYAKKYAAGTLNQSTLADKLGVDRSAVNRRLTGRVNMTEETIADMVWGLEHDIEVKIFDPAESKKNHRIINDIPPVARQIQPVPIDNASTVSVNDNSLSVNLLQKFLVPATS
jgi:plasmid maintenance system antidote protein VapI